MLKMNIFKWLLCIFAVWAALFYSSIASTVAIWERSETFTHCFIIFPICIYLIQQNWQRLNSQSIKANYWALLPILLTMALWLLGDLAQLLVIEQGATFLLLPLFIWLVLGNQVAKVLLFPMFFWMFSVPAGEFLIPALQDLTADITVYALQLTNIPVYREGLYIAVPNGLFEVAVACSGIRYLMASFTLGTLFAYLTYTSRKKQIIFVLFSLFLPLLANGIRAYGIVMIAHLSDMKYATGVDHLIYGWIWFAVVILVMFSIGNIWRDKMPKDKASETPASYDKLHTTLIAFVLIGMSSAGMYGYRANAIDTPLPAPLALDSIIQATGPNSDTSWLPVFQNPSNEFTGNIDGIDFYLAYYESNQQGQELINSVHQDYNEDVWSKVRFNRGSTFDHFEIINNRGQSRLLAYTYVTPWGIQPSSLKVKLTQAGQALLGQAQQGYYIAISIPVDTNHKQQQQFQNMAQRLLNEDLAKVFHDPS